MHKFSHVLAVAMGTLLAPMAIVAQQATPPPPAQTQNTPIQPDVSPAPATAAIVRPNYVLGSNDQLLIKVPEAEELNERPFRVDSEGNVTLPLVGAIRAAGLTVEQFEAELTKQLRTYVRSPQVTVTVAQYRSDPVFFTGAFGKPGIYSLQGQRTLLEMLSTVGGLQSNASRRIRITRRLEQGKLPLPTAIEDPDAKVSTVEISLNRLMETTNSAENINLEPYDVLYATRAEMVFINFEGAKAGAYPLDDRESLSVVQLLSLAGGLAANSSPENARVLRPILSTARRAEIPVNVKAILEGRANDYPLMPNDVLMIPRSRSTKSVLTKPLVWAVPAAITSLIYMTIRRL